MVKRMLGVLVLASGLSACDRDCGERRGIADFSWSGPVSLKRLAHTGEEFTQQVQVSTVEGCVPDAELQLRVEVRDPDGAEVPVTLDSKLQEESNHVTSVATVRFTPSLPGTYRLKAVLGPELRTDEEQLVVASRATQALQPVHSFAERMCYEVFRTAGGAWVCNGVVLRDGAEVGTLSGALASSGGGLWQATSSTLTRYEDVGSGPLVAVATAALREDEPRLLVARDDEVVVLTDNKTLLRFRHTVQGLVPAGRLRLSLGLLNPTAVSGLWSGSTFFLVYRDTDVNLMACAFSTAQPEELVASPRLCQKLGGVALLVGVDAESLWLGFSGPITISEDPYQGTGGTTSLTRLVPDGDEFKPLDTLALPTGYGAGSGRSGTPWVYHAGQQQPPLRVATTGTKVWLEELALPGLVVHGSSGPWLLASPPHVSTTYVYSP